ncbi:hypothetical protein PTKIN_Ptkin15bG0049600 [Pterospermum kingtungense]
MKYSLLFMSHIVEEINDSSTFSDGVPKEGLRIEVELVRISVLLLVSGKGLTGNAEGQSQYKAEVASLWSQAKQGLNLFRKKNLGVWPESLSFNEYGMDSVPDSWKGICQATEDFTSTHYNK